MTALHVTHISHVNTTTIPGRCSYLSFQKFFSSSIVLAAPLILANRTSTPPSASPQNELQKSSDRLCIIGELWCAYFDNEVVEDCLLVDISRRFSKSKVRRWVVDFEWEEDE